ncbi:MAG: methyl-accepting chemotaxis protein, partial [Leptospiraceae bacterium]|nr:methyl-accepting chemotaxis protein [Leptospiraceae bacterium]
VIALLFTYFYLMRSITVPLNRAVQLTSELAEGNLKLDMQHGIRNEFGLIFDGFKQMVERMTSVIRNVQDSAEGLASTAEELATGSSQFSETAQSTAGATEEISATSEQLSAGMDNVNEAASDQLQKVDSLAGEMKGLATKIEEMNSVLQQNRQLLDTMSASAQSGQSSMEKMNQSMDRIKQSSASVVKIVEVITGISEQVNLLSLNAAIEAARAGDAGRGFAVVADQVSNLAERTNQSIKEITTLLQQSDVEVQSGREQVMEATRVVGGILDGMQNISEMVSRFDVLMKEQLRSGKSVESAAKSVQEQAREIMSSMEQQKTAVNEIVDSVGHIAESSSLVSSGAEEASRGSSEVARLAENLSRDASYFHIDRSHSDS